MSATLPATGLSPYEQLGGAAAVRRLADAFYDAMDSDPAFHELRAMHAPDLTPMRDALTGFFTAWLGGPRDWITARGGFCIMSRHAKMNITPAAASQWMEAMRQAIACASLPLALAAQLEETLTRFSKAMVVDGQG